MSRCLQHERHYVSGFYSDSQQGIYAGWVAPENSFAAGQPFFDSDGSIALLVSGECFLDSSADGAGGRAESVGKSLVALYRENGASFIDKINGLFSGLLVDRRSGQAFLFNDRYGLERIYFHETAETFYFASEAKALLSVLPCLRAFDEQGVAQFLAYGCTLEWKTLFRGVSLVPGGSRWTFTPGQSPRKERYFTPSQWETQATVSLAQFEDEFLAMFPRILRPYVSSNDRLGISLTGGIDSRMLLACFPATANQPLCYTYSGRSNGLVDAAIAERVATACGFPHHVLRIGDDFLHDFGPYVDRTVFITDGCCGATGAHEIYFSRAARQLAPIRLTGNFGSEVLRSVSTFKPAGLNSDLFSPDARAAVAAAIEPATSLHPVTFAAFREVPWNLFGTLASGRSQLIFRTPYLDNELVALAYRAPRAARTSPRSALRFLERVNPELARIPTDRGHSGTKRDLPWLVRRAVAEFTFKLDYLHKEGLPRTLAPFDPLLDALAPFNLLNRHKFLPYARWFRNELEPYIASVLADKPTRELSFLNARFLGRILADHVRGRRNYVREINAVLTLEAVDRLLLHAPHPTPGAASFPENPPGMTRP